MTIHPELKCECCGHIPDDEDIQKTGYHLFRCPVCGRKVCDLCIGVVGNKMECSICGGWEPIGKNRKWWLADEI